jgi:hypothetical protein
MRLNSGAGEDGPMNEDASDLEDVQRKLDEIQSRKRDSVRWGMSRHTAERAIEAIEAPRKPASAQPSPRQGRGKTRRRKRRKRLL